MLYMSIVHSIKHTEVVHNPSHQWCSNEFYYVGGSGITSTKLRKQFNCSAVSLVSDVAVTFGIGGHSSMKVGNCKNKVVLAWDKDIHEGNTISNTGPPFSFK